MKAIFKREFRSYFNTPIGFVIIAVFALFASLFFHTLYFSGMPNIELVVSAMSTVVVFAVPFITMRLLSEDRKQKVDQVLFTSPVSATGIVLGKFFAALALYGVGLSITVVFQFIVSAYVSVNWLIYLYALLGIMLLGGVLISIGMFISSLTESSVVSAALTFGIFLGVMMLGSYASTSGYTWLEKFSSAISFIDRFGDFSSGVINVADIVYMLSISFLFIFLTVRSVERRRWA